MPDTADLPVDRRGPPRPDRLVDPPRRGDRRGACATRPPWTPPVWFYDDIGSALFDEITRLPEYYPTRAERSILAARAGEIAERSPAPTRSIELGSGTSEKTRLLLDALARRRDAAPVRALRRVARRRCGRRAAADRRRAARVSRSHAVVGDFHRHLGELPRGGTPAARVPRRHDRQPRSRRSGAGSSFDVDAILEPRRPLPARHRPRQGPGAGSSPPTTTPPVSRPRSTATRSW